MRLIDTNHLTGTQTWQDDMGLVIKGVHPKWQCAAQRCPIHNPTKHLMAGWPQTFNRDLGMLRLCPHGKLHPDPDGREGTTCTACDGCCRSQVGTQAAQKQDVDVQKQQANSSENSSKAELLGLTQKGRIAHGLDRTYTTRLRCINCYKVARYEFPYGEKVKWLQKCDSCGVEQLMGRG